MTILTVTRKHIPSSCRNSRKTMRLPRRREKRPDSTALCAEQFQIPKQTFKERWFAWWNSREFPRSPSQVSNDTDVTKGMCNCSVYPKSTWDAARLPFNGSREIARSQSHKTGGFSYYRQLQRFPEKPISNLEEQQFDPRNSRKAPWTPYLLEKKADS